MKTQRINKTGSGMTLIEIMVAIVILSILAVGGAAAAHMSRRTIIIQRNRREAIGRAHHRLEMLRAAKYSQLAPATLDYTSYYVATNIAGTLIVQASDPGQTDTVGGLVVPVETRLQYVDIDGGALSFDGLRLYVSVGYHPDPDDKVELETFYANDGEPE